jgi:hypothetical protein
MARTYTRHRTPVKPPVEDAERCVVIVDARDRLLRSVAFEWRGVRHEINGADTDTDEGGAA